MLKASFKNLPLVISAIKELRELKGSTSGEILRYISTVYNIPSTEARGQLQAALKHGVACGILKKNRGHYVLPTSSEMRRQEIAEEEIDLLDYCRKKKRRKRCKCKKKAKRRKSKKRRRPSCKRRRPRRKKCKCKKKRSFGRLKRAGTPRPAERNFTDETSVDRANEENNEIEPSECCSGSSISSIEAARDKS